MNKPFAFVLDLQPSPEVHINVVTDISASSLAAALKKVRDAVQSLDNSSNGGSDNGE
jgi:hypothetical protein